MATPIQPTPTLSVEGTKKLIKYMNRVPTKEEIEFEKESEEIFKKIKYVR